MKDLDSKLIFEAYNQEVIDEGLKDVAKKAAQYGAIGAATAASALGSPPAKSAPAAEPAPMTQAQSDYMKKGHELEQSIKAALSNKMLRMKLKQKDPAAYDALIKIKGNMSIGNEPTQNMSQEQLQATQRLTQYVDGASTGLDVMKKL